MPQFDDQIYLGSAATFIPGFSEKVSGKGFGPLGQVYLWDFVPQSSQPDNIALDQSLSEGDLILTSGPGVIKVQNLEFGYIYSLDVPRALTYNSGSNCILIVYGFDQYNQKMSEQVQLFGGGFPAVGRKAFSSIYRIQAVSTGGPINDVIVGTTSIFGFPIRVDNGAYLISVKFDSAINESSIIYTPPDLSVATNVTGDVRGTILFESVGPDGSKKVVILIGLPDVMFEPQASRSVLLGVDQA